VEPYIFCKASSQPDMMSVTVPKGVGAGQPIQVETPHGLVACTVPEGLTAGDSFEIQLPVQAAVVQPVLALPAAIQVHLPPPARWKKGICDCCSHKDCGLACCCALACCECCAYPNVKETAGLRHDLGGWCGECCLLSGCADVGLAFVGMPAVASIVTRFLLRKQIALRYNIQEDGCESFCCACCCGPCALCQQTNEIFERENLVWDGCTRARRAEEFSGLVVDVTPSHTPP